MRLDSDRYQFNMLNSMIGLDFLSFFGFSVNSVSEKIYKEKKNRLELVQLTRLKPYNKRSIFAS